MARRIVIPLVLITGVALATLGEAQDGDKPKVQRTHFQLKHGSAKDMAEIVGKHFQNEAGVQVLAEPTSNGLLITAPPTILKEITELVGKLDRRPRTVVLEFLIAEVPTKKGENGKPVPQVPLSAKELTGTIAQVVGTLEGMQKAGTVSSLKRLQVSAVENRPTTSSTMANQPYVTGAVTSLGGGKGGNFTKSVSYRSVGLKVDVTVQIEQDKVAAAQINLEESRINTPEDGVVLAKDDQGVPVRAPEFVNTSVKSRLQIPSGHAVAVEGLTTSSKSGQTQTVVVVTARIVDDEAKEK